MDYVLKQKDTSDHWYNIFEDVLRKEVKEEVGLEIKNIGYITSMVYIRSDQVPCLIVSLFAEPVGEDINLCNALTGFKIKHFAGVPLITNYNARCEWDPETTLLLEILYHH